MNRLILFRHGKAEVRAAGVEDVDRALLDRGRTDAARVGMQLARLGLVPDVALVSSATRARQTWLQVEDMFPKVHAEIRERLYNASAEEIEAELASASTARTVIVVGHNPGLQELAINLLEQGHGTAAEIESVSSDSPPQPPPSYMSRGPTA